MQKGKYVEDLHPDDFQLLEDGHPRKVALFEGPGQAGRRTIPIEVILLVAGVRAEYVAGYYPAAGETKQAYKLEVRLVNKSKGKLSGGMTTVIH